MLLRVGEWWCYCRRINWRDTSITSHYCCWPNGAFYHALYIRYLVFYTAARNPGFRNAGIAWLVYSSICELNVLCACVCIYVGLCYYLCEALWSLLTRVYVFTWQTSARCWWLYTRANYCRLKNGQDQEYCWIFSASRRGGFCENTIGRYDFVVIISKLVFFVRYLICCFGRVLK